MRFLTTLIFTVFVCASAVAQTGSPKTPLQLNTEVNSLWPDNTTGQITPFNARQTLLDLIASGASGIVIGQPITGVCPTGYVVYNNGGVAGCQPSGGGGGGVTCQNGNNLCALTEVNIIGFGANCTMGGSGNPADPTAVANTLAMQKAIYYAIANNIGTVSIPPQGCVFVPPLYVDKQYNYTGPIGANPPNPSINVPGCLADNCAWSSGQGYAFGAAVLYAGDGNAYICKNPSNCNSSATPPPSNTDWRAFLWNSGTTYASGDVVQYPDATGRLIPWKSKQSSNTNHAPAVWQYSGTQYWAPTVALNTGGASFSWNVSLQGTRGVAASSLIGVVGASPQVILGPGNNNSIEHLNVTATNIALGAGSIPILHNQISKDVVGVAISGGQGGNQNTKIEDVIVLGAAYGFQTGYGSDGLAADNTFNNVVCQFCDTMFWISQTQNDINTINHMISTYSRVTLRSEVGKDVIISGGNVGGFPTIAGAGFQIDSLSTPPAAAACGAGQLDRAWCYTFTATVANPYAGSPPASNFWGTAVLAPVYDTFMVWTNHFGIIPLVGSMNPSTNVVTLTTTPIWEATKYYGSNSDPVLPNTDFANELLGPSITISSMTYSGGNATVTTSAPHGLVIGSYFPVTITGATPAGYNVIGYVGAVTDATHFTYQISDPGGPATVQGTYHQTLFATERNVVFQGTGIAAYKPFLEQSNISCLTMLDNGTGFNGDSHVLIENMFMNTDPANTQIGPNFWKQGQSLTSIWLCSKVFPFINESTADNAGTITINHYRNSGVFPHTGDPFLIDSLGTGQMYFNDVDIYTPNIRSGQSVIGFGNPFSPDPSGGYSLPGGGLWTNNSTLWQVPGAAANEQNFAYGKNRGSIDWLGSIPSPTTIVNIQPSLFQNLQLTPPQGTNNTNQLGTYPLVYGATKYTALDSYTGANSLNSTFATSTQIGSSYGQDLTDALTGGTVQWAYQGQSTIVYLDNTTMGWMVPGLVIGLDNGSGNVWYMVLQVQPQAGPNKGWVEVAYASANNRTAGLVGTKGTLYTCTSSCTIKQQPYVWNLPSPTYVGGTPTIASGACGTGTNGAVVGGSNNQSGAITIGGSATASCTVSFSATLPVAPKSCWLQPQNAAAAAVGTTAAYISSITTGHFVITGTLAGANYGYTCN